MGEISKIYIYIYEYRVERSGKHHNLGPIVSGGSLKNEYVCHEKQQIGEFDGRYTDDELIERNLPKKNYIEHWQCIMGISGQHQENSTVLNHWVKFV